jgi:hypothetical protein
MGAQSCVASIAHHLQVQVQATQLLKVMLNPSTSNFLLVALPRQLSKVDNPSLWVHPDVSLSLSFTLQLGYLV